MNALRALAALVFMVATASAQPGPVIIDTDAGSDDVMAVSLLLSQPGLKIDAITIAWRTHFCVPYSHSCEYSGVGTMAGPVRKVRANVHAGARNMGRLLDLAGRKSVPVFAGRNAPLGGNAEFPTEWRRISDDLPGVPLPAASRPPESRRAAGYLVQRLRSAPTPVRILALGPLTNIAEALERDHSIARNIREIVIMGGAVQAPGNLQDGGVFHTNNNTAEWNIFIDPMAARIVFRSGAPIRLIALDAINKVKIDSEFALEFAEKSHSALGAVVAAVLHADQESIDQGIFYAWDPLAAAALLRPAMVKTAAMHIEIKEEAPEQGRTIASPGKPNAEVAVDADAPEFLALFLRSFVRNEKFTVP